MIYRNKYVLASKSNQGGIRIFIPEKIKIRGVTYVSPAVFSIASAKANQSIISPDISVMMVISFFYSEIVIVMPFSINSLKKLISYTLSSKNADGIAGSSYTSSDGKRGSSYTSYTLTKDKYYEIIRQETK